MAWRVAQVHPDRLERVAVINCCPVEVLQQTAWFNPGQLLKSWYAFSFQIPWMPEWILSSRDFSLLAGKVISSGLPEAFSAEALERLREAWRQPGAIRSMLAWYRANMRRPPRSGGPIRIPAMLLWGEQDQFLGAHLTGHTMELCEQGELVLFPDNTHWVNHEAAEEVCAHLIRFLASPTDNGEGS